ncbi:3-ketoacyl-CoA thiolase @ Acetyl-CoA acetyltransferase [hydrothermal vent metagenome]|uniref:3-ketoacyl-CoA thiolase @ Acetyl-CoA acetyltransferase n=1 Tax=hydrothermal vent metagenome TaxID=652676 RepID=A0A3B0VLB2_9ZZZZ
MTKEAYVFEAIRTPRSKGKASGELHEVKPIDLVVALMDALVERTALDTAQVDDVVLGVVTPVGDQGSDIAKIGAQKAKWEIDVPGMQLNRFCASGLDAVNLAAMKVRSGWESLVVAGGVESMSRAPMMSDGGAWAMDPQTNFDTYFVPQGIGADLIATLEGFTRQDVDKFALRSQQRAMAARENGRFNRSIIPIKDMNGLLILAQDSYIRPSPTLEGLAALQPAFAMQGQFGFDFVAQQKYPHVEKINHVHTAGNSSGIVDGAALVLIGNKEKGEALGLKPRARIRAAALVGTDPTIMLTGPAPASKKALKLAGMTVDDIDLFEVNEAFASVVMRFMRDMGLETAENVNVNGGAIAMGHPLGATGAMLLGTLLDELERTDSETGLVTLCVGGGMGIATIIERV